LDQSYWAERWRDGRTGWQEGQPNALLVAHVESLGKNKRVLVPLAGKSADLQWLADRGHDVVGVEYVQQAIDEFFAGKNATPHHLGAHEAVYADGVTLVQADIFDVKPESLGRFDAIYDRAALVALPPARREEYVALCRALAPKTLLLTFAYDQTRMEGPPFSVDEAIVRGLYPNVMKLAERDISRPHVTMLETAYLCGS
jgi:thiopurine S-methyltransferase